MFKDPFEAATGRETPSNASWDLSSNGAGCWWMVPGVRIGCSLPVRDGGIGKVSYSNMGHRHYLIRQRQQHHSQFVCSKARQQHFVCAYQNSRNMERLGHGDWLLVGLGGAELVVLLLGCDWGRLPSLPDEENQNKHYWAGHGGRRLPGSCISIYAGGLRCRR